MLGACAWVHVLGACGVCAGCVCLGVHMCTDGGDPRAIAQCYEFRVELKDGARFFPFSFPIKGRNWIEIQFPTQCLGTWYFWHKGENQILRHETQLSL